MRPSAPSCGGIASLLLLAAACRPAPADCPPAPTPPAATAEPAPEPAPPSALEALTIRERPDWADKYAHLNEGDMRFFDIDGLMDRHALSRAAAIEVQNHFRDLSREGKGTRQAWFAEAVERAKAGRFEDERDLKRLTEAPFIVAFDLDETLFDQYYPAEIGASCHDVALPDEEGGQRHLVMAPGWRAAFRRILELGGAVVLFSANTDRRTLENLGAIELDGKPLTSHPQISGVLTNSHLILQTKQRGDPVVEPSKDLRVFDESLKRVIIVDDNPRRLFQLNRVRVTPALDAERFCKASEGELDRRLAEATLRTVVDEIEEAERYRSQHRVDFALAYLPYTLAGRLVVDAAVAAGASRSEAIAWLREHPEAAD